MKRFIVMIFMLALLSGPAYSAQVNIAGHLDNAFTGTTDLGYAFRDVTNGVVWNSDGTWETSTAPTSWVAQSINNGVWNCRLGDTSYTNMTSLDPSIFADNMALSLMVWVGTVLDTPDIIVTEAPYATASKGDFTIDGVATITGIADGGLTSYDLKVGDTTTPDYGMIQFGDGVIGRTSYKVGNVDMDGVVLIRNASGPVTSEVEFAFSESAGNGVRFALPKSGVGNATYNPRSMLLAGPAPLDTDMVTVGYWQTNHNLFDKLVCDTVGSGADFGVQSSIQLHGVLYTDSIKESTTGGGVTFQPFTDSTTSFQVLDVDGGTPILNIDSTNENVGINTASPDTKFQVVGDTKFGDDNTNFITFTGDGGLTLVGTARVIKHIPALGELGKGGSAPSVRTTEAPYVSYTYGIGDDSHITFEMPEDMDYTAAAAIRLHWYTSVAQTDDEVNWEVQWNARAIGEAVNTGLTTDTSGDIACPTQWQIMESTIEIIPADSITLEDTIGVHLERIAIVDGTNPAADSIHVLVPEFEYTVNKIGEAM